MIIAITGASGVGKTTVLKEIAKDLPKKLKVFHLDDIGLPDWSKVTDHKKWQKETTYKWIDQVVKIAREENIDILFEGSTEITYYKEAFANNNYNDFSILLFDCSPETMKNRLTERGQAELFHQDMVNWLNYLRQEAIINQIEIIATDKHSPKKIGQHLLKKLKQN